MCLLIIWYQKWKKQFILELIVKDINFVLKVTLHPKKNQNSLFTNYNILFFFKWQASEENGHKRSTRATIDVTISGTNAFDPVVTSSSGNFIGSISEDADAGTPLRAQGSNDAIQLVVTDQDVVGFSRFSFKIGFNFVCSFWK